MLDVLSLIHRYYAPDSELAKLLIHHSQDVTQLALRLGQAHPELALDLGFVEEAAMLHDIGIYLTDAPGIHCTGEAPYLLHGYLGAELLRGLGLERHARVAERHTGSGLTTEDIAERGLPLPPGNYMPETLEEQLICYADKFFSKTKLGQQKRLEKVRQGFSKHGQAALDRFEQLHLRFGQGLDFIY